MNKDYYNNWYQIEEFPNGPYEINKMGQIRNKRTKNISTFADVFVSRTVLYILFAISRAI